MRRVHKCPVCGRTWKHHKSGGPCPANRRNAVAVASALRMPGISDAVRQSMLDSVAQK